jgi:hypothetical protein
VDYKGGVMANKKPHIKPCPGKVGKKHYPYTPAGKAAAAAAKKKKGKK